jgi:hypothetical protein
MKLLIAWLVVALACVTIPAPLTASSFTDPIIYDNGAPNGLSGDEMTHWIEADDFSISSKREVIGFTFWAFIQSGGTYMGSIVWEVYGDNGNNPGTTLYSGTAIPRQTFFANTDSGPSYEFDLSIPAISLDPGTYWLGLHNGPLDSDLRSGMFWESTDPNSSATGSAQSSFDSGVWQKVSRQHAFQVDATPEPASVLLVLSALIGFAAWGKSLQRRAC